MKTESHTEMPNTCEVASYRKICNRSHTSGSLRDKRTLIAGEEGDSSITGSDGRSIWLSIRDFHFWLWVRLINKFYIWLQLWLNIWLIIVCLRYIKKV